MFVGFFQVIPEWLLWSAATLSYWEECCDWRHREVLNLVSNNVTVTSPPKLVEDSNGSKQNRTQQWLWRCGWSVYILCICTLQRFAKVDSLFSIRALIVIAIMLIMVHGKVFFPNNNRILIIITSTNHRDISLLHCYNHDSLMIWWLTDTLVT